MRVISSKIKILILVTLCSFLFAPAVSTAREVVLGTVDFGPGSHTTTFNLGSKATFNLGANAVFLTDSSVLKSLSVSIQNGSQKGKDRASSAVVSLCDEEIFVQKDFNQNVSSLIKTMDVVDPTIDKVELDVNIKGNKNARLYFTVSAIYEEVADVPWFLDTDGNGIGGPIVGMGTIDSPPAPDPRGIWVPVGGDIS
jgi:hypothetical protein